MINNIRVYGLDESLLASAYPMINGELGSMEDIDESDLKRGTKLGKVRTGTGHDCFLKGITVQFDWRITQVIFPQIERYHFIDIISSQSKMHRLHLAKIEDFDYRVDRTILNRFINMLKEYNEMDKEGKKENFERLVYSCPMGYKLTARFTTNYLQLKTIKQQRKNHKLGEWQDLIKMIDSLPKFKELTEGE